MAIEEGQVPEEKDSAKKGKKDPQVDLQKQVDELRLALSQMQQNNQPVAAPTLGLNNEIITRLLDEMQGRRTDEAIQQNKFVSQSSIDPDDVLEEAAVFYSHKVGYFIGGDKKNGIPVPSPRGPIFFEYTGHRIHQNAKEKDIINVSKFKTYSKKERDFILNHSFFGVYFHADIEQVISTDSRRAHKMAQLIMRLNYTDSNRLLNMAKDYGIKADSNIEALRVMLAEKMVANEIKTEDLENRKRALSAVKEKELFDK